MFLLVRWANLNKYLTRILGSSSVYALLNVSSQIPRYRIQGSRSVYALLKVSSQIPRYMIQGSRSVYALTQGLIPDT